MRLITALVVALPLLPIPVAAQAQESPPAIAAGTPIFVTLQADRKVVEGSLLALSADSVALLVNDVPQTVPLADVGLIQRLGDSSRDGAVKGAIFVGLWCALVCGQGTTGGGHYGAAVVANAGLGALFGWMFDRDHVGRTTIYPPDSRRLQSSARRP